MHIVHIYTGTDLQVYVNGIPKFSEAHRACTPPANPYGITLISDLACSIPGQMFVVLLRD